MKKDEDKSQTEPEDKESDSSNESDTRGASQPCRPGEIPFCAAQPSGGIHTREMLGTGIPAAQPS